MRELTEYEKTKWFDNLGRFEAPEWITYGAEPGDVYETMESLSRQSDYYSKEFKAQLQGEMLRLHYEELEWLIFDEGAAYYELADEALPMGNEVNAKIKEFKAQGLDAPRLRALDWAQDYYNSHIEDAREKARIDRLREEIANYDGA